MFNQPITKQIPLHLQIALNELGIQEVKGAAYNPRIGEYLASVKLEKNDEIPWCAAFVNWCLITAKIKGTGIGLARSYELWGRALNKPELGCIAVYRRGQMQWQGHVNFFLDMHDDYIYGIGGNQSNKVSITTIHTSKLLCFRTNPVIEKIEPLRTSGIAKLHDLNYGKDKKVPSSG